MRKNKINKIKKPIVDVLKKHGVKKAGIFGSYARGEQKKNSDVDILVQPAKNMGFAFFRFCGAMLNIAELWH